MIQAVIFDMDGVLINSEPFWRQAEKEIFGTVGIDLTDEMCETTMGFRLDEVVQHWHDRYPWKSPEPAIIENQVVERLIQLVSDEAEAMPGVYDALDMFKNENLPIALASSSSMRIIGTVLEKLNIREYFDVIRSAEHEEFGKPHPSIFINTARDLDVDPSTVMVIEDSFNGLLAAKAARMRTIVIPEDIHRSKQKFNIADRKLNSLEELHAEFYRGFAEELED